VKTVRRVDIGGSLRPAQRLDNGMIRVEGHITRSGVFLYRDENGNTIREWRPPEEVFDAESLRSFEQVPVTNDHPPVLVTADNARSYTVGAVGDNVRRDGDHVAATIGVFDAPTIEAMERGKVELSCGYIAEIHDTPGVTPDGQPYDTVQRKIRGNHLAIVDVARAGPSARVRLDDALVSVYDDGASMEKNIETLSKELASALAAKADAESKLSAAKATIASLEAERDTATARADSSEAELEREKKARTDAEAALPERVRARVELEKNASKFVSEETKFDGMSDREIQCLVVKEIDGVELGEDRSPDYVSARFDRAVECASKNARAGVTGRKVVTDGAPGGAAPSTTREKLAKARADHAEYQRTRWRKEPATA